MHDFFDNGFWNMMDAGFGFGGWLIIYEVIKLILFVILAIVFLRMIFNRSNNQQVKSSTALAIVEERYAKGELSEEEYKTMRKNLMNK